MDLYVGDFPFPATYNQAIGWTCITLGLLLAVCTFLSIHRHVNTAQAAIDKDTDHTDHNATLPRYNPYVNPMSTTMNPNIKIRMNAPFCTASELMSQ